MLKPTNNPIVGTQFQEFVRTHLGKLIYILGLAAAAVVGWMFA